MTTDAAKCVRCKTALQGIGILYCPSCASSIVSGPASSKPTNPKDVAVGNKVPLHLVPGSFKVATAVALAEGLLKYGANNWRPAGARASVYLSALERHIEKWKSGEECDPVTTVPHLWSAAACLAILIDCGVRGNLTDDRPPSQPGYPGLEGETAPAVLARLHEVFGDVKPKHWTREDDQ